MAFSPGPVCRQYRLAFFPLCLLPGSDTRARKARLAIAHPCSRFPRFLLFTGLALGFSPVAAFAQVDAPVFSVPFGVYAAAQTVTVTDATHSARIFYTTNGTAPTTASTPYTGPITVNATETIEAMAFLGNTPSALTWAIYTIASFTRAGLPLSASAKE